MAGLGSTSIYIAVSLILASLFFQKWLSSGRRETLVNAVIVAWSGTIYLNFFFEIIPSSLTYYADWIVSTPLILLSLGYTVEGRLSKETVMASFLQFITILSGLFATTSSNTTSLAYYSVGVVSMLGVFYYIYNMERIADYPVLVGIIVPTWIAYALIWWQTGGDLILAQNALITLPFISKHVFTTYKEYFV